MCSGRRYAAEMSLWIIDQAAELFQAHVEGTARRPFVILFQQ
jgi:hypothetical protein